MSSEAALLVRHTWFDDIAVPNVTPLRGTPSGSRAAPSPHASCADTRSQGQPFKIASEMQVIGYGAPMRLTKSTDLALRVLMSLAVISDDSSTIRKIADAMQVPYSHLTKVVAQLQHLGLVETRRGRNGGMALTPSGRRASIGGLVRRLEGEGDVVDCEGAIPCPLNAACRLRGALRQAQEAFYLSLDPLTVDDLTRSPTGPILVSLVGRDD